MRLALLSAFLALPGLGCMTLVTDGFASAGLGDVHGGLCKGAAAVVVERVDQPDESVTLTCEQGLVLLDGGNLSDAAASAAGAARKTALGLAGAAVGAPAP